MTRDVGVFLRHRQLSILGGVDWENPDSVRNTGTPPKPTAAPEFGFDDLERLSHRRRSKEASESVANPIEELDARCRPIVDADQQLGWGFVGSQA